MVVNPSISEPGGCRSIDDASVIAPSSRCQLIGEAWKSQSQKEKPRRMPGLVEESAVISTGPLRDLRCSLTLPHSGPGSVSGKGV
jgi:hypothetical protein